MAHFVKLTIIAMEATLPARRLSARLRMVIPLVDRGRKQPRRLWRLSLPTVGHAWTTFASEPSCRPLRLRCEGRRGIERVQGIERRFWIAVRLRVCSGLTRQSLVITRPDASACRGEFQFAGNKRTRFLFQVLSVIYRYQATGSR